MTASPQSVVQQFMGLMEKLNYDDAMKLVSDDVEYTNMPTGTVIGPAGIRGVLEPFFAPTISNEWIITNIAVNDNVVFIERLDRHQLPGGWAELPVVGIFEIHEGKIAKWREYFDFTTIQSGFAKFLEA